MSLGRKTHAVDITNGDNKAQYVALHDPIVARLLPVVGRLVSSLMDGERAGDCAQCFADARAVDQRVGQEDGARMGGLESASDVH